MIYRDVLVVPYADLRMGLNGLMVHRGGPIWPGWNEQTDARYCDLGRPRDEQPEYVGAIGRVTEPAVWLGPVVKHFGHQISDFSTRIATSLDAWPDATFVCGALPENQWGSAEDLPWYVRELLEWFGVRLAKVRLVMAPTLFDELAVQPQAEQRNGPGPGIQYLNLLDQIARQRFRGPFRTQRPLFVSRAAQIGKFAGEAYLERTMLRSGVSVIRPEVMPLSHQLQAYLGAEALILSEGSALHGLQLLGQLEKPVHILVRRPHFRIAKPALECRADSLSYHEMIRGQLHAMRHDGKPAQAGALALLEEERLLQFASSIGIPLRQNWNAADFRACIRSDVNAWLVRERRLARMRLPGAKEHLSAQLREYRLNDCLAALD